jgi:acetolactate synthase-1/2/3 large subunit
MKLSDFVMNFIAESGVGHVFFLPGGGCMHLVDSLGRNAALRKVCCLHEQAAAIAAEAYGQVTNTMGAVLVTTGPGATNAITGVAGAWIDSTPLLVISGQAKRSDLIGTSGVRQRGVQEVDIIPMVGPITKYAVTVMDPATIGYHLQKARHLATHGRKGPVWIDIPLDVQGSIIDEKSLPAYSPDTPADELTPDELRLRAAAAARLIAAAKRPVLLAGNGIRLSGATAVFRSVIEALGIPVLLTWKASDFLEEGDPRYCGKPGIIGQRGANFTQQRADVLLTVGARLDLCQIGFDAGNFAPRAKKIIVDIDSHEIDKLATRIDLPVPADAGMFLGVFLDELKKLRLGDFSPWLLRCRELHRHYPVILPEYRGSRGPVNPYHLIDVLSDLLTGDDVFVPGSSGSCAEISLQAFRIKAGQRLLNTPGLGAMGFGLPASFGACLASGGRRTTTVIGDGGLQHNIQELQTIARLGLPLKIFILNNNGYASIRNMQKTHFNGNLVACDPTSGLTLPDTCSVAAAYGLPVKRIRDQANLRHDVAEVLAADGPVVCDVLVDQEVPTAPRMSSRALPDGRMVSMPFEDLWPFLDREEFNSTMAG